MKPSKSFWRRFAARQFVLAILRDGVATADVVDVQAIPEDLDRRAIVGPALADLRDAGIVSKTRDFRPSKRSWAHANPKRIWKLIDRGAAEQWLAKHGPLTPPPNQPELF